MNNFYHTEAEHFVQRRWVLYSMTYHRFAKSLTFHTIVIWKWLGGQGGISRSCPPICCHESMLKSINSYIAIRRCH